MFIVVLYENGKLNVNCTTEYYINMLKFNFGIYINRACARTKVAMMYCSCARFQFVCVKLIREFGPRRDFIHYSGFLLKNIQHSFLLFLETVK